MDRRWTRRSREHRTVLSIRHLQTRHDCIASSITLQVWFAVRIVCLFATVHVFVRWNRAFATNHCEIIMCRMTYCLMDHSCTMCDTHRTSRRDALMRRFCSCERTHWINYCRGCDKIVNMKYFVGNYFPITVRACNMLYYGLHHRFGAYQYIH